MQHDSRYLLAMLLAAEDAVSFTSGKTYVELLSDRQFQLALSKAIEMVGEAASRVSSDFTEAHPGVPWKKIVGMRHYLAHAYFAIDLPRIWDTTNDHLPELIDQLKSLLLWGSGSDSS